jgi:excisionase family DNA binding protein
MSSTPLALPTERLWNAQEAADLLGVSERWIRDHATRRSPRIPVIKLGSLLRFRPADIEVFIEQQRDDHSGAKRRS